MSAHGIAHSPKKRAEESLVSAADRSLNQADLSNNRSEVKADKQHQGLDKKLQGKSAVGGNMAPDTKYNKSDRSFKVERRAQTPTKDELRGGSRRFMGAKQKDAEIMARKPAGSKLRAKSVEAFERVLQSWQPAQMVIPSPLKAQENPGEQGSADILRLESSVEGAEGGGQLPEEAPAEGGGEGETTAGEGEAETKQKKDGEEEEEEELDPDVDIELQRELRKMEKRIQSHLSVVMLQAVEAMGQRLLEEALQRETEQREAAVTAMQQFLESDAQALQAKMETAVEDAVTKAMGEAVAEHGVPTKYRLAKPPDNCLAPLERAEGEGKRGTEAGKVVEGRKA